LIIPVGDGRGQIVGVVRALNQSGPPRFTDEDQPLLRAFASFADLAIDQFQRLLENLYDRRSFSSKPFFSPSSPQFGCPIGCESLNAFAAMIAASRFDVFMIGKNDQFRILLHFFESFGLLLSRSL
jgi:hypothetical protein